MVVAGGLIGLLLKKRLPERLMELPVQAMAFFIIVLGMQMSLGMNQPIVIIASIAAGSIIGEIIDLEGRLNRFAKKIECRLGEKGGGFSQGFVTTSVLYCTGSMAVLGAFQEGLGGFPDILIAKGMIDGIISIPMAASMGFGVVCSAATIFIYQGSLTLAASWLEPIMTELAVTEMTAAGGIMIIGLGFNLIKLTKIRVMNMLPSLIVAVVIVKIFFE
jgi:uncharacterized membrane protein YqgA involved in biofilm formation